MPPFNNSAIVSLAAWYPSSPAYAASSGQMASHIQGCSHRSSARPRRRDCMVWQCVLTKPGRTMRPVRSTTRSLFSSSFSFSFSLSLLLLLWERRVTMGLARTAAVVPMRLMREPVVRMAPSRMISRRALMVIIVACLYRTDVISCV